MSSFSNHVNETINLNKFLCKLLEKDNSVVHSLQQELFLEPLNKSAPYGQSESSIQQHCDITGIIHEHEFIACSFSLQIVLVMFKNVTRMKCKEQQVCLVQDLFTLVLYRQPNVGNKKKQFRTLNCSKVVAVHFTSSSVFILTFMTVVFFQNCVILYKTLYSTVLRLVNLINICCSQKYTVFSNRS